MVLPGIYIHAKFSVQTCLMLSDWCVQNHEPTPPNEWHSTICYSKEFFFGYKLIEKIDPPIRVDPTTYFFSKFEQENLLVLAFACPWLEIRHAYAMNLGASHDFPTFQPHVTLSTNFSSPLKRLILPIEPLEIIGEKLEYLRENVSTSIASIYSHLHQLLD